MQRAGTSGATNASNYICKVGRQAGVRVADIGAGFATMVSNKEVKTADEIEFLTAWDEAQMEKDTAEQAATATRITGSIAKLRKKDRRDWTEGDVDQCRQILNERSLCMSRSSARCSLSFGSGMASRFSAARLSARFPWRFAQQLGTGAALLRQ